MISGGKEIHSILLKTKKRKQRGQVFAEAAIVIPAMLVFILTIIQLGMMQHAKIMLEYAAFNAARAGIVHNGHQQKMTNAAMISMMPTFSRTDTIGNFLKTWVKMRVLTGVTGTVGQGVGNLGAFLGGVLGAPGIAAMVPNVGFVDVRMIQPTFLELQQWNWKKLGWVGNKELDFDEGSLKHHHMTIEVIHLYPLRIPFANYLVHLGWVASNVGAKIGGLLWTNPEERFMGYTTGVSARKTIEPRVHAKALIGLFSQDRDALNLWVSWMIAKRFNYYLVPMKTTYSMNMHSNFYVDKLPK